MPDEHQRRWVGSMPDAYERWLVPAVFRPFAVDLAQRAAARAPRRVLELAAGTGVLTRELLTAMPDAHVTATDLNEAMVDTGGVQAPSATWRQADAMDLPFGPGEFDLVTCQFGIMFFPDKPAAFAQARRVLSPDGVLLVSSWGALEAHDFQAALVAGLERAFPDDPPTFMAAVPHGYADRDVVIADLAAGGFGPPTIEHLTLEGEAESAADLAAGYCLGTPLQPEIEARGDLDRAVAIVADEMAARLGPGPVTGNMSALVVEARPAG